MSVNQTPVENWEKGQAMYGRTLDKQRVVVQADIAHQLTRIADALEYANEKPGPPR